MPPKGNEARAAAMAEMAGLLHRMRTEPALAAQLARAEQEPLDDLQRANLREMQPRLAVRAPRCPSRWCSASRSPRRAASTPGASQRPANDWTGFVDNFREVLALAREEARNCWRHTPGCAPTTR